jgi:hypothetical protein
MCCRRNRTTVKRACCSGGRRCYRGRGDGGKRVPEGSRIRPAAGFGCSADRRLNGSRRRIEKVISEFGSKKLDDPQADAELRAIVGEAQLLIGKPREASVRSRRAFGGAGQYARASWARPG